MLNGISNNRLIPFLFAIAIANIRTIAGTKFTLLSRFLVPIRNIARIIAMISIVPSSIPSWLKLSTTIARIKNNPISKTIQRRTLKSFKICRNTSFFIIILLMHHIYVNCFQYKTVISKELIELYHMFSCFVNFLCLHY